MKENDLKIEMNWDRDAILENDDPTRHLLVEISAPDGERNEKTEPLNLALAIDTSGSMAHGRLDAAKRAAIEVIRTLTDRDHLSLVHFGSHVNVVLKGVPMDRSGKDAAVSAIWSMETAGMTNLSGGWFEAGRCVAEVMDRKDATNGRILILSDGMANQGICDSEELTMHARKLAERGVATSAVGIGDGYSPLQLDALADGGGGRLHDAADPEELHEAIVGELNQLRTVVARNLMVTVESAGAEIQGINKVKAGFDQVEFSLGELTEEETRPLAVSIGWPKNEAGTEHAVNLTIRWQPTEDGPQQAIVRQLQIPVVSTDQEKDYPLDLATIGKVADLQKATLDYRSLRANERRDYVGAKQRYTEAQSHYMGLVAHLPDREERLTEFEIDKSQAEREWHGREKLNKYVKSKKQLSGEFDLKKQKSRDRRSSEHLNKE